MQDGGHRIQTVLVALLAFTCCNSALEAAEETASNPKLTPEEHLRAVLEDKDPHSLWLLMARGSISRIKTGGSGWLDVNIATTRHLVDQWSRSDDYRSAAERFLENMGLPRDRGQANTKHIKELQEKFPDSIVLETKHYHIFSRADQRTTKNLAKLMDAIFELYDSMFGFEEKIPYKSLIVFWKDRNEYFDNGGLVNSAAYYSPSTKMLVGYNTKAMPATQHMDPYKVMFHEGWHQYFDFYIPNAPLWYNEGFAEVFSPTNVKGRKAKLRRNAYQARVAHELLLNNKLMPLSRLFQLDHSDFRDPETQRAAYAESYSFITFLMNFRSGDRKLEKQLRSFYKDYFWELRKGTDPVKAVDIVFGDVKIDVLEELWKKSIQRHR